MAMADCYYVREQQLQLEEDAVVHRLLPPEILVEIGIADHAAVHARRERSSHDAVVEELAARLVGILGLSTSAPAGGMGEKKRGAAEAAALPPPTRAATPPCSHPHPHYSHVREQHLVAGAVINGRNGGMVRNHAPGFGTTQYWLPPPRPMTFVPPASFAGTGVFLPRAEVYPTRTSNPPRKQVRNRRIC